MKIFKITILSKLLYLGVIVFLLLTYFSAKEIYTYNLDGLGITETSSVEYPLIPKRIKSLKLKYKGLYFTISKHKPLIIVSNDSYKRYSTVKNIELIDKTLKINLENSVTLTFRVDNRGQRLTIGSNIPKVFPTIKELILPFSIDDTYTIEKSELSYKISNNNNEEFHLKLNDKYYIDDQLNNFHLISEDDKISTLTFSPLSDSDLPIAEQWYVYNKRVDTEELEIVKTDYLDKVDKNINETFGPIRYIEENNSWQGLPTTGNFTENGIITYLSQAMKSGNYQRALDKIKALKSRYPNTFKYQSTPFLGNIVVNGKEGAIADRKNLSNINRLIRTSDPDFFKTWIPKHFFIGSDLDIIKIQSLINNVDKYKLNIEELGITLNNLVNILETDTTNSNTSDSVKEITDLILKNIKWDESGIYLIDENSISNQKLNLRIGQLLIDASQHETSEYSKPVGEGLIKTYLENSTEDGGVYTTYNIKEKTYSEVQIPPEDSFLLLSDNPYIPHYFQSEGIKIWTISDSIVVDKNTQNLRITITYPVDLNSEVNSHFLTIIGVKPYKQLYFKGTLWRADKVFERYGVGYYYEDSTQLLYFMPNHKKPREEIVITY